MPPSHAQQDPSQCPTPFQVTLSTRFPTWRVGASRTFDPRCNWCLTIFSPPQGVEPASPSQVPLTRLFFVTTKSSLPPPYSGTSVFAPVFSMLEVVLPEISNSVFFPAEWRDTLPDACIVIVCRIFFYVWAIPPARCPELFLGPSLDWAPFGTVFHHPSADCRLRCFFHLSQKSDDSSDKFLGFPYPRLE